MPLGLKPNWPKPSSGHRQQTDVLAYSRNDMLTSPTETTTSVP
jgi:hypothetical protein